MSEFYVLLNRETEETTYKRNFQKRIELIIWTLENMNNPDIPICDRVESRMSDIILKINQTHSIFDADKLHSELRILDWIFFQVCSNEIKKFERISYKLRLYK